MLRKRTEAEDPDLMKAREIGFERKRVASLLLFSGARKKGRGGGFSCSMRKAGKGIGL